MHNKKSAFSLVEIIIALAIIVLLAVIGLSANQGYKDNVDNTKIISDIETINNALESYGQENNSLPMPGGNTNFFKIDTSYSHSYTDPETFGVYGSITEDTLPKKYLDVLPLDPRTNSYYSYGKTGENVDKLVANQFELASVQNIDGEYQAFVTGNYTAEAGPYNLIREYNGSNFVYDKSNTNLPYNPEELILIATVNGEVKREGDTITTIAGETKEIYFSDGSVSVLEPNSTLTLNKLNFPSEDNLSTIVKLSLGAGTIWTKATHLSDESEFEIYTTDSTAAVRGTIFGVSKDNLTAPTDVLVLEGEVEVYKNDEQKTNIADLIKDESARVIEGQREGTATLEKSDFEAIEDNFIVKDDIRGTEAVAMINQEIIEREKESDDTVIIVEEEIIIDIDVEPITDSCTQSGGPEHSSYTVETVMVTAGETIPNCDWSCNDGYSKNGDSCIASTPSTCTIGDLTGTLTNGVCTTEESNITPGVERTVDLSGEFDIEIVVDSIPDVKQYLLYWNNGDLSNFESFKLFFNEGEICFQKSMIPVDENGCKEIGDDNIITISRDSSDEISLNGSDTDRSVSGEIDEFKIGYFPLLDSHILQMSHTNNIDITINNY